MNLESNRLLTFVTNKNFAYIPPHFLKKFALTGLYGQFNNTLLKCNFCHFTTTDVQKLTHDVIKLHLDESWSCPLLNRGRFTTNVPINANELEEILPILEYNIWGVPKQYQVDNLICRDVEPIFAITCTGKFNHQFFNENMASQNSRQRSFKVWSNITNKQLITEFVQAGFYFCNQNKHLVCFCCGRSLQYSQLFKMDKAVAAIQELHIQMNPLCDYLNEYLHGPMRIV